LQTSLRVADTFQATSHAVEKLHQFILMRNLNFFDTSFAEATIQHAKASYDGIRRFQDRVDGQTEVAEQSTVEVPKGEKPVFLGEPLGKAPVASCEFLLL